MNKKLSIDEEKGLVLAYEGDEDTESQQGYEGDDESEDFELIAEEPGKCDDMAIKCKNCARKLFSKPKKIAACLGLTMCSIYITSLALAGKYSHGN